MIRQLFSASILLSAVLPSSAQQVSTTCNLRYNNLGIIHGNIPCSATFSGGRLQRVSFTLPSNNAHYRWTVGQPGISPDPRWPECVRHTGATGNQWQACTVPSPDQLGIRP